MVKKIISIAMILLCLTGCDDKSRKKIPTRYQPAPASADVGDSLGNFYVPCIDNKGTSGTHPCIWDALTNESVDEGSNLQYRFTIFVTGDMMCPEVYTNDEQCIKLP